MLVDYLKNKNQTSKEQNKLKKLSILLINQIIAF